MNISPPRDSAARNVATLPPLNARILNRSSRNIGAATRRSITTNAASSTIPPTSAPITPGAVQPMLCPP